MIRVAKRDGNIHNSGWRTQVSVDCAIFTDGMVAIAQYYDLKLCTYKYGTKKIYTYGSVIESDCC